MTKAVFTRKQGRIIRIECEGHTGYGVEGEAIVCAAISSIVQTAVLGVLGVALVNAHYEVDDRRGYLLLEIPEGITKEQKHDVQVILQTLLLGVSDLHEAYSNFVRLEVKEL